MPFCSHLLMNACKFSSWSSCTFSRVWHLPHTIMSSTIVRTSLSPAIAPSNRSWNNSGATDTPNGRRCHLKWPMCVANVVRNLDSSSRGMCQYPLVMSHKLKHSALPRSGIISSSTVDGKWLRFRALLSGLGSKHIHSFPLGFLATTKPDRIPNQWVLFRVWSLRVSPDVIVILQHPL